MNIKHKSLYASSRYAKEMNEMRVKYDEFYATQKYFSHYHIFGINNIFFINFEKTISVQALENITLNIEKYLKN